MRKDLKDLIQQFNEIHYPNDMSKRIIIATLKPEAQHENATIGSNN